jgi:hypothetical protein
MSLALRTPDESPGSPLGRDIEPRRLARYRGRQLGRDGSSIVWVRAQRREPRRAASRPPVAPSAPGYAASTPVYAASAPRNAPSRALGAARPSGGRFPARCCGIRRRIDRWGLRGRGRLLAGGREERPRPASTKRSRGSFRARNPLPDSARSRSRSRSRCPERNGNGNGNANGSEVGGEPSARLWNVWC